MPGGRPTEYNQDIAEKICRELATGMSLVKITNAPDRPGYSTVMLWVSKHPEFMEMYTRARLAQADAAVDKGWEELENATEKDDILGAARKAEVRLKFAEKLNPRKYGNKLELSGSLEVTMTDDQLDSRLAQLLGKAGVNPHPGGEGETPEQA